jgi:hypothetical protein
MAVHHLHDFGNRGPWRLEILNVQMGIVLEARARVVRKAVLRDEGQREERHRPDEVFHEVRSH